MLTAVRDVNPLPLGPERRLRFAQRALQTSREVESGGYQDEAHWLVRLSVSDLIRELEGKYGLLRVSTANWEICKSARE